MIPKPPDSRYEVAVVGLGYVGIPLAVGFAEAGCRTLGFDLDEARVRELQEGRSPLTTVPSERIHAVTEKNLLTFTENKAYLSQSEAIIICVPTPLRTHLDPDITFILSAGEEIAPFLRKGMLVSLESSTYPGTTREDLRKVLEEKSGLKAGVDFALAFSPEREDPGNAKSVLKEMPKVVGGLTPDCLTRAVELYSRAVSRVVPVSSCDTAEAVKLTENIFRFINIALVNELKRISTPGISADKTPARNLRGKDVAVKAGTTSVTINFPVEETDASYAVFVEKNWIGDRAITKKDATGFTIQFEKPAPADAKLDWMIVR